MLIEILISALRTIPDQLQETGEALNPRLAADHMREAILKLESAAAREAELRAEIDRLRAMVPNSSQVVVDVVLLRDLAEHGRKFESFSNPYISEQLDRLMAILPEAPHD